MIRKFLNKLGFYKLDQLQVGGHCGICGKPQKRKITFVEDCGWTICQECDE